MPVIKRPPLPKKAASVDLRVPRALGPFGGAPASALNGPAVATACFHTGR